MACSGCNVYVVSSICVITSYFLLFFALFLLNQCCLARNGDAGCGTLVLLGLHLNIATQHSYQCLDDGQIETGSVIGLAGGTPVAVEDAVQCVSASYAHSDVIITRDKKGFANAYIPVMTPAEFIERSRQ